MLLPQGSKENKYTNRRSPKPPNESQQRNKIQSSSPLASIPAKAYSKRTHPSFPTNRKSNSVTLPSFHILLKQLPLPTSLQDSTPLHSTPFPKPSPIPMDFPPSSSGEAVMAALLRLPPPAFSDLTRALAADIRLQDRRLSLLLLSPLHFSDALAHLHSLSLPEKTHLLARFLLHHLHALLPSLSSGGAAAHRLRLRDFDAAVLLMAMCDGYDSDRPHADWRTRIAERAIATALSPAGLGAGGWAVLGPYVDAAGKCRRLFEAVSGEEGKVAAAAAAVVALPSVECRSRGRECVICKEEMEVGRDVCKLPCGHLFHWGCVLGWLRTRNTCPCCRFELPTDDVFYEIGRIWRTLLRMDGKNGGGLRD